MAVEGEFEDRRVVPVLRDPEDAVGRLRAAGRGRSVKVPVRSEHERSERVMAFLSGKGVHRLQAAGEVHSKDGSAGVVLRASRGWPHDRRAPQDTRLGLDQGVVRAEAARRVEVVDDGKVPVRLDPVHGSARARATDEVAVAPCRPVEIPVARQEEVSARVLAKVTSGELVDGRGVAGGFQPEHSAAAERAVVAAAKERDAVEVSVRSQREVADTGPGPRGAPARSQ